MSRRKIISGLQDAIRYARARDDAEKAKYGREYMIARCEVTGNPVGTDTRAAGHGCECSACRAHELSRRHSQKRGEKR